MKRGRPGAGALAVPSRVATVDRPAPLLDLTPEQADVWRSVVDALPADWFRPESFPLLAQLCRHTIDARRVAQLIDAECSREDIDAQALDFLLKMQARETAALKAMSSALRVSQQSSMHDVTAGRAKASRVSVARPWE